MRHVDQVSIITAVSLSFLSLTLTHADEPVQLAGAVEQANEAIIKKLNEKISFDFKETPLRDVVRFLSNKTGINVVLDEAALNDVGVTADSKVTLGADEAVLRTALNRMLAQFRGLTYDIRDEALVISTWGSIDDHLVTRLYDIEDFPRGNSSRPAAPARIYDVYHDRFPLGGVSPSDMIIDVLKSTVDPDSWEEVGGPGSIRSFRNVLIVSQTREVHERIAATLASLRQVRDSQIKEPGGEPVKIGWTAAEIAAEKRFLAAMAKKVSLEFSETPLQAVADHLTAITKLPCELDYKTLDEVGIDKHTPVTISIKNVTLRSALRHTLRKIDPTLAFVHRNDGDFITAIGTDCGLVTCLFPIADFVTEAIAYGDDPQDFVERELVEAILKSVEPESWSQVGGPGSMVYFEPCRALIVSHDDHVLERIALLLAGIRKFRGQHGVESTAPVEPPTKPPTQSDAAHVLAIYHLAKLKTEGSQVHFETLPDVVKKIVAPASWSESGGTAQLQDDCLIVRQRPEVHDEIFELLSELMVLKYAPSGFSGGSGF